MITCQHLVHCGRYVHLRQALAALGMVEAHVRAALQRQPHALTVHHHAGDAAAAVGAHLEAVLQRRKGRGGGDQNEDRPVWISRHLVMFVVTSCASVAVLMTRTLFWEPHHSFPPTGTILVTGLLDVPRTSVWDDCGSQKLPGRIK